MFDDRLSGLRVGLDMDGVLADFNAGWMKRYNHDFGAQLETSMVTKWDGLHGLTHFETMADFWAWARGDDDGSDGSIFRDAPAMSGAVEATKRIAREHRVAIVSSKFDWAIPDSLTWLARQEIPAREIHFLWDKTLADCDVYLDDAPHQLEELSTGLPDAIICRMVHPWNDPMPGVIDVHSWPEFEAVVARVAQERARHGLRSG